jgi:hypothetical protein
MLRMMLRHHLQLVLPFFVACMPLTYAAPAPEIWAVLTHAEAQKTRIYGLRWESKKFKIYVPSSQSGKKLSVRLRGYFKPAGRDLRSQGKWIIKSDPDDPDTMRSRLFVLDIELEDKVTPVELIAVDRQGRMEMERVEISQQEIRQAITKEIQR